MSLTPEQLTLRMQGITGSEIATVAGLGKGSLWSIWAAKMGAAIEVEDNPAMIEGRHYEPALVEWVRLYHPRHAGQPILWTGDGQRTIQSKRHPLVIATPDGVVVEDIDLFNCGQIACIEAKKPSRHTWHEWSEDEYPIQYSCQCTWEAAACEVPETILVAHVIDRTQMYDVPFDAELFGYLLEEAERFWRDYVLTRTPPPVDGSRQASEWLQRRFPKQEEGKVMEAGELLRQRIDLLRFYEGNLATAKDNVALIQNEIKEAMGDAELLRAGEDWIKWKRAKDSRVLDVKAARALLVELGRLEECEVKREGGRRMTKSWTKEEK